jgi:hypothetical protein
MSTALVSKLPDCLVDHIKLFTGEGEWRNGKYVNIRRIPKSDSRYSLLTKMPRIKQITYNFSGQVRILKCFRAGCVWFKLKNNKFIVLTKGNGNFWNGFDYIDSCYWEMQYNKCIEIYFS